MAIDDAPAVKGTVLVPFRHYLTLRHGQDGLAQLLASFPPATRSGFEAATLPMAWYPFAIAAEMTQGILDVFGEETLRWVAAYNLHVATKQVLRLLFRFGSPEFMVGRSDRVWKSYYSRGAMEVREVSEGHAVLDIVDFAWMTATYRRAVQYAVEAVVTRPPRPAGTSAATPPTRFAGLSGAPHEELPVADDAGENVIHRGASRDAEVDGSGAIRLVFEVYEAQVADGGDSDTRLLDDDVELAGIGEGTPRCLCGRGDGVGVEVFCQLAHANADAEPFRLVVESDRRLRKVGLTLGGGTQEGKPAPAGQR